MAGQLSLFGSKRQRGKKPKPALERSLHILIADTLTRWLTPGWCFTHIASGEYRSDATAALLRRMGVRPGFPDFLLLGPPGFFGLEVKRRGGRLTPAQTEVGAAFAAAAGGHFMLVDNFEDALAYLIAWGALPSRVTLQGGVVVVKRDTEARSRSGASRSR
jgi:hypothetical protein